MRWESCCPDSTDAKQIHQDILSITITGNRWKGQKEKQEP